MLSRSDAPRLQLNATRLQVLPMRLCGDHRDSETKRTAELENVEVPLPRKLMPMILDIERETVRFDKLSMLPSRCAASVRGCVGEFPIVAWKQIPMVHEIQRVSWRGFQSSCTWRTFCLSTP